MHKRRKFRLTFMEISYQNANNLLSYLCMKIKKLPWKANETPLMSERTRPYSISSLSVRKFI